MEDKYGRRPLGFYYGRLIYDPTEWWDLNMENDHMGTATVCHVNMGTALYPPQSEYIMTTNPDRISVTFHPATRCEYCHSRVLADMSNCPQCGAPLG